MKTFYILLFSSSVFDSHILLLMELSHLHSHQNKGQENVAVSLCNILSDIYTDDFSSKIHHLNTQCHSLFFLLKQNVCYQTECTCNCVQVQAPIFSWSCLCVPEMTFSKLKKLQFLQCNTNYQGCDRIAFLQTVDNIYLQS